jgi:hypothetical protein
MKTSELREVVEITHQDRFVPAAMALAVLATLVLIFMGRW